MRSFPKLANIFTCIVVLLLLGTVLQPASGGANHGHRTIHLHTNNALDQVTYDFPFRNPELSADERITDLLSRMTIDEKLFCLSINPSVPRLGVVGTRHVEGIHGLTQGGPAKWGRPATVPTTTFPQGYGLGETWDVEMLRSVGAVEGFESRYVWQSPKYHQGGLVVRSPNADLGRDPRWGRTEECYGEDPFLNGSLVVAFVKGLQGNHPRYWQAAALMKHFLANSNENDRTSSSSNFDERLFREYYSVPFRMGIEEGGARAFMASYNRMNSVPMTVNPVLEAVARKEWGQDGIICTDGGAFMQLVTDHKYFPDLPHAAAAVIKSGVGQFLDNYFVSTKAALNEKLITESDIDKVLRGNFRVMIKLGLLDPAELVPYSRIGSGPEPWLSDENKSIARKVTDESVVLLKNSKGFLPLNKAALKSIAVIGPRAHEVYLDWYSGTPPYTVTPLDGIKAQAGPGITVGYESGNDEAAALKLAREADVAVVVVGNHPTCDAGWAKCPVLSDGKEAVDRRSIDLEQEALVKQVFAVNPRTVVVLVASFPFAINWTNDNIPAILHLAHNSEEEGNAVADVLFGAYNPAGRLVQTWPASVDQLPPMMDYDITHGRTYMYAKGKPLYPFGYGLSYTTFAYSGLRVSARTLSTNKPVSISLSVKNTGKRAGDEVVQLYISHVGSKVVRPIKELKGFTRIALQPGESKRVEFQLRARDIAYWESALKRFVVEPGRLTIVAGASSADDRLTTSILATP